MQSYCHIYRKASLTVKNVNDHLDALNIDVVDNRNIVGNCLTNSGLHLNSTRYDKPPINFIKKKMKTLSKIDGPLTVFVVSQKAGSKFVIK